MEKKKLLLVAVSVGVVLLIIIGIPLILLTPRQNPAPTWRAAAEGPVFEHPRAFEPPAIPQFIPQQQPEISLIQPEAQPEQAPLIAPAVPAIQEPPEAVQVTTITVPTPRTVAVPDTVAARPAPRAAAPAPRTAAPAARPAPARPAPARTETATPAPSVPTQTNYWVQTGAFSTMVRAEGAKESLEAKGITSIIENRNIDGRTWYRVRVGPYVSESEANYWLALVKSIDGFGESQIRQTQAVR